MTAIETYYIGPTNRRGSRVKALALGTKHSLTIEWDDARDAERNHGVVAKALIRKMGWDHHAWFGGNGSKGSYVFVCALPDDTLTFDTEQIEWAKASPRAAAR